MKRILHMAFIGLRKYILVSLLVIAYIGQVNSVNAQVNESFNDGQLRLRVWLHAVYTDANCTENIINGPSKFVFNKLRVRASNGTGYIMDNFPQANLFLNQWPQDMRFRVKGDANKFYRMDNGSVRMLNPFYPFEKSTFPNNQTFMNATVSERAPNGVAGAIPVGLQNAGTYGYLLMDRTFGGEAAPDRYEWKIDEMFESDADLSGEESVMNIGGVGCNTTLGLPSYYEGDKGILPPYDFLMNILMLDSFGVTGLLWGTALGGCIDLFGYEIDPFNIFNIIAGAIGISDYDDSYASKKTWNTYPAFFRGSSANTVGYYTTEKIKATDNRDGTDEGYVLVFAHMWEWSGPESGYSEPSGTVRIQNELCPAEQYTDGPITLQVWLDGYFTDGDHEGTDIPLLGEILECSDFSIGPQEMVKEEEKYIRARAATQFTGIGPWSNTVKNRVNRPQWINIPNTGATRILNNTYGAAESGMNTFNYEIQSWESDCYTDQPTTCDVCIIGNSSCCILNNPFGGGCLIPGIEIGASDFDYDASITGEVNWRNSPPNTDNYVYVPVRLSTTRYDSHLARLKYRWTIANPNAGVVDGPREVLLCPGETHTMSVTGSTNATWYQWQYADVVELSCPADANWQDIDGAICPENFTTSPFTGTRAYRMLVYNRNGPGSKTPYGDKYAIDSTVCTIITVLDSLQVPIDAPIVCGTAGSPTTVRAGSAITLRPVLPPSEGSTSVPGVRYEWTSIGGTVSPGVPLSDPWETTLSFPSTSPTTVEVNMTTILTDVCPTATDMDTSCFFITEDPGCSGTTGVIYVSHLAAPGGIGTINKPYTLEDGFGVVNGDPSITHVKILAGNYVIDSTAYGSLKLRDNLVVEGNYVEQFDASLGENVWVKTSNETTNITSHIVERINNTLIHTIGFRSFGDNWILQDINITTGDAPARDDLLYKYVEGRGLSNYPIHIDNSTGWKMINVTATAGQAGVGSKGPDRVETCPDATPIAHQDANSPGHPLPGFSNNNFCGRAGADGGLIATMGGSATPNTCPTFGCGGAPGLPGNTGLAGTAGSPVAGYNVVSELDAFTYYTPKDRIIVSGSNGGGGGGGGGSATQRGAAGGLGGLGGSSGYGSGGAFGIWISGSSTGEVTNFASGISSLAAPLGGQGGDGLPGYAGGLAPAGAGAGGVGGQGGQGGLGAPGGVGGANLFEYVQPGSIKTIVPPNYPIPKVEADYASGCTNSKIIISKTVVATWSALVGAQDYPDIAPLTTTTPLATSNPKFIYYPTGALGAKDLVTSAGTYQNQIYVRYERPMPTMTVPSRVCFGTPIDLISTPGMADPIDHEWVIQANSPLPTGIYNNPTPVYQIQGEANPTGIVLPNPNPGSITYQVRYRVRDNCCGWSIPIYSTIEVLPEIDNVIGFDSDTTFICGEGDPSIINTNPAYPIPGGAWTYQWYQNVDGGPFTPVASGGTSESYNPPPLGTVGTYQFMRVIGSSTAACSDTSNLITIIVTENFQDNFIDFPVPYIASCGPIAPPTSGTVNVANTNVGFMNGSVPTGPGTASTFYYQWQKSTDSVAWTNIANTWPSELGLPEGVGSVAQSWDPGVVNPSSHTYGTFAAVFPNNDGSAGRILFRRIVKRDASETICVDTSNFVATEVYPGRKPWGNCPTIVGGNNNAANCRLNYPATTALYGYTGTCAIIAPDTICPGSVTLDLDTTYIGGSQLRGEQFAWYSVEGGPYNRTGNLGFVNYCAFNQECTNPMESTNCANPKPLKADFVSFAPYSDSGSSVSVIITTNTTFYVNAVDQCFDDAEFRLAGNPDLYTATPATAARWQRKTVIVVIPPIAPTELITDDSVLCDGEVMDSIVLEIVGGDLGNAGRFAIYDTDPTVGGPHTPIYLGEIEDDTTGRFFSVIPGPVSTTTYYARVESKCDTTDFVTKTINFVTPSVVPDALLGPDLACNETITLTVDGGSLGDAAEWVLYDGDPLTTGTAIANNVTGSFDVTPSADITYYVRAESTGPCPDTDAVSKFVAYTDSCVCDANPGIVEYAPTGVTTIATLECEGSDGWTYYSEVSDPLTYLFAIQKTPGSLPDLEAGGNTVDFNATVALTVTANPTTVPDVFYAQDLGACEANFVMPRYWNVSFVGPTPAFNGHVRIRFFFPPGELAATLSAASAWRATHNMSTCGLPLTVGPAQVFKTNDGTAFNPNVSAGLVPAASDVLPTTINNYNYIAHLLSSLPHTDTYPQVMMGKNYVQVAWDGFSGGGAAIRVSPDIIVLPVTLLYFTGSMIDDQVVLDWETASELNNDYFVVEKSNDAINWSSIGSVDGNGTTNVPHKYQLIDGQPFNGNNYYRLKQVDFDGTVSYSRVILIDVNNTKSVDNSFTVLPNPTAGPVVATIVSDENHSTSMRILDVNGRLMGSTDLTLNKGVNQLKLDLTKYPAATYFLTYTDNNGQEVSAKVIKQ